ncbi:hypothetical protein B0H99_10750 [Planomicrobium soli]|uniref:ParB-like nuclease family protein n=1 Tax=Planomicrobium soli TaxID=1176648 RepID=A0A2P8GQH8_9BACL|nr:ParB/RepB/Spo0J family partition protein [Planomicrobium soli]PSL36229.1 hypothetical protein B0H99_10750 [Planomicrobium soli]
MTINLLDLIGKDIAKTTGTRKLTIKGATKNYEVYRIPLNYLFYNDQNGRIATWISKHIAENKDLNLEDKETYNEILHNFIKDSNENALKKTKANIKLFGQRVAGVVLKNGRIIDGNRRFTCLRELAEEGGDYYFEAVILDTDSGISPKDIKRLELNLQHAEEQPVDYNPIDNLVDIYRDLVLEKTFTVQEYATNVNEKKNDIEKLLKKATLMVEFLDFIDASGKYYIAREMNLDGPLQEILAIVNRVDEEKREDTKSALFTALLTSQGGDLTRYIRDIGKNIINTRNIDDFLEEYEEIVEKVYETFQEEEEVELKTINEKISTNKELKEKSSKTIEKKIDANRLENARSKPVELLNKALVALDAIDAEIVGRMDEENKQEFEDVLNKIEESINMFGRKLNV